MSDPTEVIRRLYCDVINAKPLERAALELEYGQVWSTEELRRDFEVIGFAAPLIVAKRKADGIKGSLFFQHHPRFYFFWQEDKHDERQSDQRSQEIPGGDQAGSSPQAATPEA